MIQKMLRARRSLRATMLLVALGGLGAVGAVHGQGPSPEPFSMPAQLAVAERTLDGADTLFGLSGKLRARLLSRPVGSFVIPELARLFGDSALQHPGVYALPETEGRPFSLITMLPFERKTGASIGRYRIGFWPGERRKFSDRYRNPEGFIVVTRENQDTRVSEHFRLRDFLTKGQANVWPKYLVLRLELVDKLELVIAELEAKGIPVEHMAVMSGFRTPDYNANGGNTAGRASNSRHMFGDAADVFVDNDRNGRMDDLNGDGRVNGRDMRVLVEAVEAVERKYPELVGGLGEYRATSAHGPFAHVDVRGVRARWGHS